MSTNDQNELDEIKTSEDYETAVKKNPQLNYNTNIHSLIIKNEIPTIEGLKIFIKRFNLLRTLYLYAAQEDERFHKNLIHSGIVIGWGINIFTIVVTSYESNIPASVITMVNSIGNLISVIIVTIVNFYAVQAQIIEYKRYAFLMGRMARNLQLDLALKSDEDGRYDKLFEKYYNDYHRFLEESPYVVSRKTQEKFYKKFGEKHIIDLYQETVDFILTNFANKLENKIE